VRGGGLYGSVTLGMRKRCTSYYGLEEGWALPEKKRGHSSHVTAVQCRMEPRDAGDRSTTPDHRGEGRPVLTVAHLRGELALRASWPRRVAFAPPPVPMPPRASPA
jgi:hypothetical protein